MKTTKNRKRVVNTAALGVSLLLSSTLLVGNAVSTTIVKSYKLDVDEECTLSHPFCCENKYRKQR